MTESGHAAGPQEPADLTRRNDVEWLPSPMGKSNVLADLADRRQLAHDALQAFRQYARMSPSAPLREGIVNAVEVLAELGWITRPAPEQKRTEGQWGVRWPDSAFVNDLGEDEARTQATRFAATGAELVHRDSEDDEWEAVTDDEPVECPGHYDDDATLLSGVPSGTPTYCDGTCQS